MDTTADRDLPSWSKLLSEGPAIARLLARQFRRPPVRATGGGLAPAMVLPGFMTSDLHTGLLRRTIRSAGGRAFDWGRGLNSGADPAKFGRLLDRINRLTAETGERMACGMGQG